MTAPDAPMAETTATAGRDEQIRARIAEIAPYPSRPEDVTPAGLGKHLAVRALVILQESPDGDLAPYSANLLTLMFTAAHALSALDGTDGGSRAAMEIWRALSDVELLSELLWRELGDSTAAEVTVLADELLALRPPALDREAGKAS